MNTQLADEHCLQVRRSLIDLCRDSGILAVDNVEEVFYEHLIETGLVDSLGIVCLQEQIETHYQVVISQEQFVAELHTLDKLAAYLAVEATL